MAIQLNADTKYATQGTVTLPSKAVVLVWGKTTWTRTDGVTHNLWGQRNDNGSQRVGIQKASDNNLYAGWAYSGSWNTTATGAIVSGTWQPHLFSWDPAGSGTHAYRVGDLTSGGSTVVAAFSTFTLTGERTIGRYPGTASNFAGDIGHWTVLSGVSLADLTAEQLRLLQYTSPRLVPGLTLADYVSFNSSKISGATVTAEVGTNATLVGSPSVVDGPEIVEYRFSEFQQAIKDALAESGYAAALAALGVSATPQADLISWENFPDVPSLVYRTGGDAATSLWAQSEADARAATHLIDGTSTLDEMYALAEIEYEAHVGGSWPPTWTDTNGPNNYLRDVYAGIIGAAFTYTNGLVVRSNCLSTKVGSWNQGWWPGDSGNPVKAGPQTSEYAMGKFAQTVRDAYGILIVAMYGEPFGDLQADGSGSGAAGWRTRANWLADYPQCADADADLEAWKLAGPSGADLFTSLAAAYPEQDLWTSFHTGYAVGTDATKASREAEIGADNLTQMAAAGCVGNFCFDVGYESDADVRAWWLELVQRYNQTGPYAPSGNRGGIRRAERGRSHSRRSRR